MLTFSQIASAMKSITVPISRIPPEYLQTGKYEFEKWQLEYVMELLGLVEVSLHG